MFNYDVGIGGQEDPHNKEVRENIYPLPDNRTLFIEQFTDTPPSESKMEYNCTKIEDVFALYQPELFVSLLDEQGQTVAEQFRYRNPGDFHPAQLQPVLAAVAGRASAGLLALPMQFSRGVVDDDARALAIQPGVQLGFAHTAAGLSYLPQHRIQLR